MRQASERIDIGFFPAMGHSQAILPDFICQPGLYYYPSIAGDYPYHIAVLDGERFGSFGVDIHSRLWLAF